ncbi:hypothetical protein EU538_04380 [Candidatus Thorarchaeota archaeon]|nr:MAG: hypothetical protein EU538_04380 [Candidatus Thorarchaeota archaeon]
MIIMAQQIPPGLEEKIKRYENLRRKHEALQVMVQRLQSELNELEATLEELAKQPDDAVTYKTVGQVMFRVDKKKLVEEMNGRKGTVKESVDNYGSRLESTTEQLQELQSNIQIELGAQNLKVQ